MTNYKYAGIGSRKTPPNILKIMTNVAKQLDQNYCILRSGAADGADSAFESGVFSDRKEIYLPWIGFRNHPSKLIGDERCMKLMKDIHPAWHKCSRGAKLLHARNVKQILGDKLNDPVDFVLCWTENGEPIGGTATAINIADALNVPVFNFGKYTDQTLPITFDSFMEQFEKIQLNIQEIFDEKL